MYHEYGCVDTEKYLLGNLFLIAIIPESEEEGNVPLIAKYWEAFMFEKVASEQYC